MGCASSTPQVQDQKGDTNRTKPIAVSTPQEPSAIARAATQDTRTSKPAAAQPPPPRDKPPAAAPPAPRAAATRPPLPQQPPAPRAEPRPPQPPQPGMGPTPMPALVHDTPPLGNGPTISDPMSMTRASQALSSQSASSSLVASPSSAHTPGGSASTVFTKKRTGELGKARRAAAGSEAVRDQIKKLAVGGPQSAEERAALYEVSDSDDEGQGLPPEPNSDLTAVSPGSNGADAAAISEALRRSVVFAGMPEQLLQQAVGRMFRATFPAGATVLQQGAMPRPNDCIYLLAEGLAEVVITGGGSDNTRRSSNEEQRRVEGHAVRILQHPGWLFGDIALLFNSPRTASVVAKTDIAVWAMERGTFIAFVMRYAQGARALRFVRKVPLLKGLSDNDLLRVAMRMPQRTYTDGAPLISYGERGDEMYLIRYGRVRVLVPTPDGARAEVAVLGRGQFVGERSVINDRLRSADCVAQGPVTVIVLRKRDFLDLDNPLLAWMLDYDAVSAVLKSLPAFQGFQAAAMEQVLDRFDARQELPRGEVLLRQGDLVDRLVVIKMGEVALQRDGLPVVDPDFVREAGGFTFFGGRCLEALDRSPYTVTVASDVVQVLALPRRQLDGFLGAAGGAAVEGARLTRDALVAALRKCPETQGASDAALGVLADASQPVRYRRGEVVVSPDAAAAQAPLPPRGAVANGAGGAAPGPKLYLVRCGEVVLLPGGAWTANSLAADSGKLRMASDGHLVEGDTYSPLRVAAPGAPPHPYTLVSAADGTVVVQLPLSTIHQVLGSGGGAAGAAASPAATAAATAAAVARGGAPPKPQPVRLHHPGRPLVRFSDLEQLRVVGTGQFGLVRVVRHRPTNQVYALKVMHKAPLVESKQLEHVANERSILEEAGPHPFLVSLVAAYQDERALYLLQEWVPGGELFHHLDVEGSFTDAAACFYAANVLLALQALHARGIVYRDLKPENLLLDPLGYVKMADFGFAKKVGLEKTFTICGTPDYQAPEVIMRRGTGMAADFWALGVLIFEMLVGDPPFKSLTGDPWDTFRRTLLGRFYVPHFITEAAADLIYKLLQVNPERRLGSGAGGVEDIKAHPWFAQIDWTALEARRLPAPITPRLNSPLDTSHFDEFDDADVAPPPAATLHGSALEEALVSEVWQWVGAAPITARAAAAAAAAAAPPPASLSPAQHAVGAAVATAMAEP